MCMCTGRPCLPDLGAFPYEPDVQPQSMPVCPSLPHDVIIQQRLHCCLALTNVAVCGPCCVRQALVAAIIAAPGPLPRPPSGAAAGAADVRADGSHHHKMLDR
jgi:hypothetical protein